jgi:hypothetical protein
MIMTQPPNQVASLLVKSGPFILIGIGALLTILRRGVIGLPLIFAGITWLRRMRPMGAIPAPGGRKSTVRSVHLEMELDHDTGEMDGTILTGRLQGQRLSSLNEQDIIDLCREFHSEVDTCTLLESYLDRLYPEWREHVGNASFSDQNTTSGSQTMSRQEACQILGVADDATREEILQAWRNLIKKVHPDSGGSAFLTAKINTAKDILLR